MSEKIEFNKKSETQIRENISGIAVIKEIYSNLSGQTYFIVEYNFKESWKTARTVEEKLDIIAKILKLV